jgi:DUF1680 family protein
MRGPVVYCIEATDNGPRLFDCMVDVNPVVTEEPDAEFGMPVLKVSGWQRPAPEGDWLYRPVSGAPEAKTLIFVPYYTFANRGESDMRVWIPLKY